MSFYDWNSEIETNIPVIDSHHKKLIDLVNELHSAMKERRGREVSAKILDELTQYSEYHFGVEEKAFDKYSYPRAQEQKKMHSYFVGKLKEMKEGLEKGSLLVNVEVLGFLVDWIEKHILNEDMLYLEFFKDKEFEA